MTLKAEVLADAIDTPVEEWEGNCHGIATAVQPFFPDLIVIRGLWVGPVHKDSLFAKKPFSGHSWLGKDGSAEIVDPTRWTFEMTKPYIYFGQRGDEYDENGEMLRFGMSQHRGGFPEFDGHLQPLSIDPVFEEEFSDLTGGIGPQELSGNQVMWLANLPRSMFGTTEFCLQIYRAVIAADCKAFIPFDNISWAERNGLELAQ